MNMMFDNQSELDLLRKNLKKRNRRQILLSTLTVLLILLVGWYILLPAAEQLYWDPREATYLENVPDLELTMSVYTELFGHGQLLMPPEIRKTGFAAYQIDCCFLQWKSMNSLTDLSYRSAFLERGNWQAEHDFWNEIPRGVIYLNTDPDTNDLLQERKQQTIQKLKALPDYVEILAAVTYCDPLTLEEFSAQKTRYHWQGANYLWAAFRVGDNYPACGIHLTDYQSSRYGLSFWQDTEYPHLFPERLNWTPEIMQAHITSMLRYSADRAAAGTGLVPSWADGSFYTQALEYVEQNGVQIRGCYLIATPELLLELLESEDIGYIHLSEAWIGI